MFEADISISIHYYVFWQTSGDKPSGKLPATVRSNGS